MKRIELREDGYYIELDEEILSELGWDEYTKVVTRLGKLKGERVIILQEI